ncbi:MAG: cobalamin-dependent protein [Planctomycetes bacterium]|nr:cobalamin-dependent protein [Planctomycetota bacterium]
MLVTLIRPPLVLPLTTVTTSVGVPPIGVAYLAGSIKHAGHEVRIIDSFGEAIHKFTQIDESKLYVNGLLAEDIVDRIPHDSDIIGVSCMYSNEWVYTRKVVAAIKRRFPHVPLIVGGEHVTSDPEYIFRSCPCVNSCVLGEGEETIVDLISSIKNETPLREIKGIAYIDNNGSFLQTQRRSRIASIDKIPWPLWEELPLENYLSEGLGMASVRGRNMPMIASRGCPYKCGFCSNLLMWNSEWIIRRPQFVVEEMKYYKRKFKINNFELYDLTAIIHKKWVIEFTELLTQSELNITWSLPSGTRSEALDKDVLVNLYKSGCRTLTYSPESGSAETLARIRKKVNLKKMLQSMRWAVKNNITVKANLVVGFPAERKRDILKSFRFMLHMALIGVHDVAVFPFVPYPGSELFSCLIRQDRIPRDKVEYEKFLSRNLYNDVAEMRSWSKHISHRLIRLITIGGMLWFYFWQFTFRPHRLIMTIYRTIVGRPETMIDRMLDGLIRKFALRGKWYQITN